jgi:hypothetical protein
MLAIGQHAQDVHIVLVAARGIGGGLAPDTVADLEVGQLVPVAVGVEAQIERRGPIRCGRNKCGCDGGR